MRLRPLTLALAGTLVPAVALAESDVQPHSATDDGLQVQLSQTQAAAPAKDQVEYYGVPGVGYDLPDWSKRIFFQVEMKEDKPSSEQLYTYQPFFENGTQSLFWQINASTDHVANETRAVFNPGIAYRHRFMDNKFLVGANFFIDEGTNFDSVSHTRASFGGEVGYSIFKLNANYHLDLSGTSTFTDNGARVSETPLDGLDWKAAMHIPYFPWAKLSFAGGYWTYPDGANVSDKVEWHPYLEAELHPNLHFEVGYSGNSLSPGGAYVVNFRFHAAEANKPTLMSSKFFDPNPNWMPDQGLLGKIDRSTGMQTWRRAAN